MSKNRNIIEGRILSFDKSPFSRDFDLSSLKIDKKRIFIIDGIIESIEPVYFINPEFQDIEIIDYGDHLISAGFVDAHVHYPQTAIILRSHYPYKRNIHINKSREWPAVDIQLQLQGEPLASRFRPVSTGKNPVQRDIVQNRVSGRG